MELMGYLIIDHSQGAPRPGMKRSIKQEWDTVACKHCGGVVRVPVQRRIIGEQGEESDSGHFCMNCMGPVCNECLKRYGTACVPLEKALMLRRRRKQREAQLNRMLEEQNG